MAHAAWSVFRCRLPDHRILLFLYSRSVWLTMLPLVCSVTAVIWQLGPAQPAGLRHRSDEHPDAVPGVCHRGQSRGTDDQRLESEKLFGGHSPVGLAQEGIPLEDVPSRFQPGCVEGDFARLLAPGSIALLSDTIGFLTILLINIRIIQELAITASIGVAVIIFTNLVLLPVLLSYVRSAQRGEVPPAPVRQAGQKPSMIWDFIAASLAARGLAGGGRGYRDCLPWPGSSRRTCRSAIPSPVCRSCVRTPATTRMRA
jgi:uncharacterized protein